MVVPRQPRQLQQLLRSTTTTIQLVHLVLHRAPPIPTAAAQRQKNSSANQHRLANVCTSYAPQPTPVNAPASPPPPPPFPTPILKIPQKFAHLRNTPVMFLPLQCTLSICNHTTTAHGRLIPARGHHRKEVPSTIPVQKPPHARCRASLRTWPRKSNGPRAHRFHQIKQMAISQGDFVK